MYNAAAAFMLACGFNNARSADSRRGRAPYVGEDIRADLAELLVAVDEMLEDLLNHGLLTERGSHRVTPRGGVTRPQLSVLARIACRSSSGSPGHGAVAGGGGRSPRKR
jgi:hypothetical protein